MNEPQDWARTRVGELFAEYRKSGAPGCAIAPVCNALKATFALYIEAHEPSRVDPLLAAVRVAYNEAHERAGLCGSPTRQEIIAESLRKQGVVIGEPQ